MTHRLGTFTLATALGLVALLPTVASAAVAISHLRVGPDALVASPGLQVFPAGTTRIFVRFDYKGAANDRVRVVLESQGGLGLFQAEKRYTGDGTETLEITGPAVYVNLATGLQDSAQRAQETAAQAVSHQHPTELLKTLLYGILRLRLAEDMMQKSNPGKAQVEQIKQLRTTIDGVNKLVDDALQLSDEDPGRPALIQKISTQFGPVVAQATAIKNGAGQATGALIPPTGMSDGSEHLVQVLVGTNLDPAITTEFKVVRRSVIYTPVLAQRDPLRK